jgi:hypothetical protein
MPNNKNFNWNKERSDHYLLIVDSGNEYFKPGRIKVSIKGTGELEIENLFQGKRTSVTGKLDSKELEEIFSEPILGSIWNVKYKKRLGIPDEARIRLNLFEDGKEMAKLVLWKGVAKEHKQSAQLVRIIQRIVENYSDG